MPAERAPLSVTWCCADTKAEPWLAALHRELPDAVLYDWHADPTPADYAVVWAPPQAFFDSQPQLQAVFNIGAGVNALMALPGLPPHLPVVRLEDAGMAQQMAEYVTHAVLRHYRGFDGYDASARAGEWRRHAPPRRADYPVGVMGMGTLGTHVAQVLAQFGFPVHGWARTARHVEGVQCFHGAAQLDEFLQVTRILVCLLPLTPQTQDIVNARSLALLRPGGYLINVARGALVVDDDLLAAIASGHLAGATLDVFRTEPLPAGHAFWKEPKITLTPHISAATLRDEAIAQIAGKIRALREGRAISGIVERARGY